MSKRKICIFFAKHAEVHFDSTGWPCHSGVPQKRKYFVKLLLIHIQKNKTKENTSLQSIPNGTKIQIRKLCDRVEISH